MANAATDLVQAVPRRHPPGRRLIHTEINRRPGFRRLGALVQAPVGEPDTSNGQWTRHRPNQRAAQAHLNRAAGVTVVLLRSWPGGSSRWINPKSLANLRRDNFSGRLICFCAGLGGYCRAVWVTVPEHAAGVTIPSAQAGRGYGDIAINHCQENCTAIMAEAG